MATSSRPASATITSVVAIGRAILAIVLLSIGELPNGGWGLAIGLLGDVALPIWLGIKIWHSKAWAAWTLAIASSAFVALGWAAGQQPWIIPTIIYWCGAVALHRAKRRPPPTEVVAAPST